MGTFALCDLGQRDRRKQHSLHGTYRWCGLGTQIPVEACLLPMQAENGRMHTVL